MTDLGTKSPGMVRVLMVLRDSIPPFRPDVRVLFGSALPQYGINCDLVGRKVVTAEMPRYTWPAGATFLVNGSASGVLANMFGTIFEILCILKSISADHDIIQVRDKIRAGIFGLVFARIVGKPFVYWMSFPMAESYLERSKEIGLSKGLVAMLAYKARAHFAAFAFYTFVVRRADHIFVQSAAMLDALEARGVQRSLMSAVPMGVDMGIFKSVVPALELPAMMRDRRVITYLGVLALARRSEFLLEVLEIVRKKLPDVLLLIVGDAASDDEKLWFRAQIAAAKLNDHVLLTGWLSQESGLSLVACAEVGLSPIPRGELFDVSSPTKAVEYLALGVPCVGNDIPDQKLVLEQSGGGLCVQMQIEAFSAAIVTLLENPDRARAMGAAGRAWVAENRSYERLAQAVAPVYHALAAVRRARLRVSAPTSTR